MDNAQRPEPPANISSADYEQQLIVEGLVADAISEAAQQIPDYADAGPIGVIACNFC